jgi:hypothetical protein
MNAGGRTATLVTAHYFVEGVLLGLGFGPEGAGWGQLTGIVFGVGR